MLQLKYLDSCIPLNLHSHLKLVIVRGKKNIDHSYFDQNSYFVQFEIQLNKEQFILTLLNFLKKKSHPAQLSIGILAYIE